MRIININIYNLLRWNDVPRTSRVFCLRIAIFSQFSVYSNITQEKQVINLLLLSNFCPVISFWQIQKDILMNYCAYTIRSLVMVRVVASSCQRKEFQNEASEKSSSGCETKTAISPSSFHERGIRCACSTREKESFQPVFCAKREGIPSALIH